jgi:peptidoglycan/LPS O-acetylase OafA/YrhL
MDLRATRMPELARKSRLNPVDVEAACSPEGVARRQESASGAAFERFRRIRFFSSLDGLRAVSILAVIWHHTAATAVAEHWAFLHRGNRGVMLFFVISAFLISTLLLRAKEGQTLNVPRFWARRALRILPLFYVVLAVYVAVVFLVERDLTVKQAFFQNLPAFATFTSNWFVELDNARVIFYFAWSLAAEEQFYLCWPWIERYFSKAGPVLVAVLALFVSQAAGFVLAAQHSDAFVLKIVSSVPAAILLGVVVAHVLHSRTLFVRVWTFAGRRGSAWLAAVFTLLALSAEPALGFFGELLTAVAMALLVCTCVIREDNDLAPLLRIRAVAWVGTISYGVYLMHMLSVSVVRRVLAAAEITSPYWEFAGGALLSIGVASISYCTFERYFLGLKDRWFAEQKSAVTRARESETRGETTSVRVTAAS